MEDVCSSLLLTWFGREKHRAFVAWRENSVEQRHMEDICSKIVGNWMNLHVSGAFKAWQQHAHEQLCLKNVFSNIFEKWLHLSQFSAFKTWTANAHEQRCQRHMEDVYGKIMCTRRKLAISKVWHTWRSYAGHQRHLEDAGRTIVMRWLNQGTRKAFLGWHMHAVHQLRMYNICGKILQKWVRLTSWRSFHAWRTEHDIAITRRLILYNFLSRQTNMKLSSRKGYFPKYLEWRTLKSSFKGWISTTILHKHERTYWGALATSVHLTYLQNVKVLICDQVFENWHQQVALGKDVRGQLEIYSTGTLCNRTLARCFKKWCVDSLSQHSSFVMDHRPPPREEAGFF